MSGGNNNNGQDSSIVLELVDSFYEPNQPLCAKYKKGFGYETINHRLPVILTKVIDQVSRDKNDISDKYGEEAKEEVKEVIGALARLKNEMVTNKQCTPSQSIAWTQYLKQVADQYFDGDEDAVRWYVAPWLYVECYMYHKMNEAFRSSKFLKTYDPFKVQKEGAFFECIDACDILGRYVQSASLNTELLQTLLEVSLWGNRCDLSISQGEANNQTGSIVDQLVSLRPKILANDSRVVWQTIGQIPATSTRRLGYVLDNSAFELFTDLILVDCLLDCKLTDHVDFYVKAQPWFISDVLVNDFHWLLDSMLNGEKAVLADLASKWKNRLARGTINIVEHEFWTYPHAFYEMKEAEPSLYKELQSKSFLIFKGDLNYRKLIADTNWDFTTPFVESLQGFTPAPLVALRTLKADCVSGLPPGVGEKLSEVDHSWMNTGEYGLIQFAQ